MPSFAKQFFHVLAAVYLTSIEAVALRLRRQTSTLPQLGNQRYYAPTARNVLPQLQPTDNIFNNDFGTGLNVDRGNGGMYFGSINFPVLVTDTAPGQPAYVYPMKISDAHVVQPQQPVFSHSQTIENVPPPGVPVSKWEQQYFDILSRRTNLSDPVNNVIPGVPYSPNAYFGQSPFETGVNLKGTYGNTPFINQNQIDVPTWDPDTKQYTEKPFNVDQSIAGINSGTYGYSHGLPGVNPLSINATRTYSLFQKQFLNAGVRDQRYRTIVPSLTAENGPGANTLNPFLPRLAR